MYILPISGSKIFNFHYIITNTYIIFGFNLVMIRPNHVYFMYILSISGSKIFNFHFYWV